MQQAGFVIKDGKRVTPQGEPISVEFLIDDQTSIVGRLEVGSAATVDYRTDGARNIARHIVVRSAIQPY